jgi:hypothetical protein
MTLPHDKEETSPATKDGPVRLRWERMERGEPKGNGEGGRTRTCDHGFGDRCFSR